MENLSVKQCTIQWKDTRRTQDVDISTTPYSGMPQNIESRIFYYAAGEDDFQRLTKKDNGEKFVVIGYYNNLLF